MTRTRTATILATAALALTLAACGGDSDAEDDVEQAVRDHTAAVNAGDVDGVQELTSQRCREQLGEEGIREAVDLIKEVYGDIELESVEVTDITDDTAQVDAVTGIEALDNDESARWVLEDGQWRNDAC